MREREEGKEGIDTESEEKGRKKENERYQEIEDRERSVPKYLVIFSFLPLIVAVLQSPLSFSFKLFKVFQNFQNLMVLQTANYRKSWVNNAI